MKQIVIYSFVIIVLLANCVKSKTPKKSIPCIPDNLQTNVIAFYPFSNGSLNDYSGNNHHLSNNTTAIASSDRNGNSNCAFEFNNPSPSFEYLTLNNTTFLNNLNEFSISFWYEPLDTTRNGNGFETLICRGDGFQCPDRNGQWSIGLYDSRAAVFGRTNSVWDNHINYGQGQTEVSARTNNWAHLVATFNQSGIIMSIYRNSVLQQSKTGNGICGINSIPTVQDIGNLFIGKNYTGKIDDIIIFDKVLTQQEINTVYGLETCCGD